MKSLAVAIGLCLISLSYKGNATPKDDFKKAEAAFRFQDYKTAEKLLVKLLYPKPELKDKKLLIKAREYLGACYFWLKKPQRMQEEFTALLVMNPNYKLDPFYYPVPLIEKFEALKKRLIQLGIIKQHEKSKKVIKKKKKLCKTIVKKIEVRDKWVCAIPFGVGQFAEHRTWKGVVFAVTQGVGLATNIGAFIGIVSLKGADGYYSPEDAKTARILRYVQYGGLGLFVASAIWGVVDAFTHFQEKVESDKVIIGPCGVGLKF